MTLSFYTHLTPNATATETTPGSWRLELPAGPAHSYRVTQIDDYTHLRRRNYPWHPPLKLSLRARINVPDFPGTWGFGLWNDPFTASLGLGGMARRLPALPNAAWFFHASSQNYLAIHDDHPASGWLAATFSAPILPAPLYLAGLPILPLLINRITAPGLRRLGRRLIHESAARLESDPTLWHTYTIEWTLQQVSFYIDETLQFSTTVVPQGPLGLVLWVDNQYAALPPDGALNFGSLSSPAVTLELEDISIFTPPA